MSPRIRIWDGLPVSGFRMKIGDQVVQQIAVDNNGRPLIDADVKRRQRTSVVVWRLPSHVDRRCRRRHALHGTYDGRAWRRSGALRSQAERACASLVHRLCVTNRQKHPHQHNHVRVKNTVAATALVAWLPTFDDVFVVFIIDCNSLSTDVKIYYLVTNCLVLVKAHHLYSATNNKLQLQRCFASQTERAYRPLAKSHAHGTLDLAAKYHTQPRSAV